MTDFKEKNKIKVEVKKVVEATKLEEEINQISADLDTTAKGRDTVRGQLELNYPIYTGGKISAIIEQARLNKNIAKQSIIRDKNSVVYDVKKYFYAYILGNSVYSSMFQALFISAVMGHLFAFTKRLK